MEAFFSFVASVLVKMRSVRHNEEYSRQDFYMNSGQEARGDKNEMRCKRKPSLRDVKRRELVPEWRHPRRCLA